MTSTSTASFARTAALLAILTLPSTASASLGGNASSVDADRVHAEGALMRIVRSDAYALHEIRSATGTTIREFVNGSGTVFAVAWDGPWMPDLRQVLGDRFDRYQAALKANQHARRGRGAVVIDEPDLVVQISGHQRAFNGRAYVPALVPSGVQLAAIR
jgi:hypothetical protein